MMRELSKKRIRSSESNSSTANTRKSQKKDNEVAIEIESNSLSKQLNTVYDLIEARACEPELRNQPSVLYASHGTQYVGYTAAEIHRLSAKAAVYYSSIVPERTSSNDAPVVVALLAPSTFEYLTTVLALGRLGHTVLFLSTRLSEDAHVHLINRCGANHLFIDESFRAVTTRIVLHCSNLSVQMIASQEDIASCDGNAAISQKLDPLRERKNIAWIIHSSGSTSLPKPNYYSHAAALGNSQSPFGLVGLITLPLFHMQGLGSVFRSIMNRKPIYMWNAHLPLTNQHLKTVLMEHPDIQILYGVPYVMKLLADTEDGIGMARRLKVLLCGGGACPKPVGDLLTSKGVYLVSHVGSSETGQLMNSHRPREDFSEWDWLRPSTELQKYLRWEPYDTRNNIFEMVLLEGWPSKVASNRDDDAYATNDLWERHPEYPRKNAWRYHARKDDTIVLNNGEKANPIIFEDSARESPLVDDAIVFGTEKPHLGIFVLASAAASNHDQVVDAVWPLIQRANVVAPAHAQISVDMIRILGLEEGHRIKKTDKSTIIRPAFYKAFATIIDAAYKQPTDRGSLSLDRDGLVEFLTSEIKSLIQSERRDSVENDSDLFSIGLDSLQTSRLRSLILKRVDIGGNDLPETFVYDYPSINAMASELLRTRLNEAPQSSFTLEEKMENLVEKYSSNFPIHRSSSCEAGEHVVVTGATGSLGAHIVAQLTTQPKVRSVYCLVRATSHSEARKRVLDSFRTRGLDVCDEYLQALAVNFTDVRLGLSDAEYAELAAKSTCVIHTAWNVNFNLSLESFDADCLHGTRSLIDICLQAGGQRPADFVFCSSISAVAETTDAEIGEELSMSLSSAQKMGYAQSKLVAENICLNASNASGLTCCVLRIGQIVGDTKCGIWNRQEAVPMIIQSANTIQALPELEEECSWLPVDIVATAVIECKDDTRTGTCFYNVVNENRFQWTRDLLPMLRKAGLDFEAVPPREWLRRLRECPDPSRNPPYRLIDFFTAKYGGDVFRKAARYRSEQARNASRALREYSKLDQELLNRFVRHIAG